MHLASCKSKVTGEKSFMTVGGASVKTVIDTKKVADIQTLISYLCCQIGIPHVKQLELCDNFGN